jgi:hypothetical protein
LENSCRSMLATSEENKQEVTGSMRKMQRAAVKDCFELMRDDVT